MAADEMLVRILACALAPGDCRVLSGMTDYVQAPPSFPYIPGGDVCAVVEEVRDGAKFNKGDHVVCHFTPLPLHGLAQYRVISIEHAALKPASVSAAAAAGLASSALTAMLAAEKYVRQGSRVLVLGGSGGVGCALVQLARHHGASFVACTSTQAELMKSLRVDQVVDYRAEQWWEVAQFQAAPFDVIFDLVGTVEAWQHARAVLKSSWRNGNYVTLVGDNATLVFHSALDVMAMASTVVGRALWTRLAPSLPNWTYHVGLDPKHGNLARLMKLVDDGHLRPVMDAQSPFPFTEEGVKAAFHLQKSRHAHGKVVVQIAEE